MNNELPKMGAVIFAVDMSALADFYADVLEIGIVAREVDRVVLETNTPADTLAAQMAVLRG